MSCNDCKSDCVGQLIKVKVGKDGYTKCAKCEDILIYPNGDTRERKMAALDARESTADNWEQFTDCMKNIQSIKFKELTPTTQLAAIYLAKALALVAGDRQAEYGDFADNCIVAAKHAGMDSDPDKLSKVTKVMQGFKLARLKYSTGHFDSRVDDVGYAALRNALEQRTHNGDFDANA